MISKGTHSFESLIQREGYCLIDRSPDYKSCSSILIETMISFLSYYKAISKLISKVMYSICMVEQVCQDNYCFVANKLG